MSWTLAAPPGTVATIRSISSCVSSTSGSISGVIACAAGRNQVRRHLDLVRSPRHRRRQLRQRRRREQRRARPAASPARRSRSISAPPAASGRPARRSCRAGRRAPPAAARPDLRQRCLRSRPAAPRSRAPRTHLPSGAGSALRSSLPFGVSGNASSRTYAAGTMYSGSAARRCARSASDARLHRCSPSCTYATSRLSPGQSSRATTTASRTAGMRRQPRLDLPKLDPEAADLHLEVVAAQELDVPVRAATAPDPPSGTSARPAPPLNGSATNRSAVSSGRFRYPRATPAPPM